MSRPQPNPAGWLWALGAGTLVMAARWREIGLHGGEMPILDQWLVEGRQILLPWLEGKLTLADFFRPHHEHAPAWTRLIAWLEAVVFGRWDNQLQATLNAVLMGGFTGLFAAWLRRSLPLLPAFVLTGLAVILASLPHNWENSVWGFQAHMPLALIFVFAYQHGTLARPAGTARWWLAQAAGLAALFTLGSMWAAPVAVLLVLLWTSDLNWRKVLAAGLLALGGAALLVAARAQQPLTGAATLGAKNLPQFIAALLMQLGWPSAWPGAALLMNLPVIFLAWRLRGRKEAGPLDRTALTLGLWAAAQAAAFAFARGSYIGFVSRYGDLLALGVLANGLALWRLMQDNQRWPRLCMVILALAWSGAVAQGLNFINIQGHTLYFHEHSAQWAQTRREAVRQYLATKDQNVLASAEVRAVLFPDPAVVAQILDHPGLANLLPASVRADQSKTSGDFFSDASRDLRGYWLEFACSGGLLLLTGLLLTWKNGEQRCPGNNLPLPAAGATAAVLAVLALASGSLLFLWPEPLEFRVDRRWARFLTPTGTVPDMSFRITSDSPYPKDRLAGGAALWPEDFRNTFFGTHIDGPAFTGTAQSSPFPLSAPWFIIPYAGYPVSAGNALRFRIEDAVGTKLDEFTCPGPNPGPGPTDIGFWEIDVRKYAGKIGRLILQDQRTDAEGWVAAAPPHPVEDGPKVAATHRRSWAAEGTLSGLRSLQIISVALGLLAACSAISLWSHQRRPNAKQYESD
jgi:hypothetical protein